jgi:hypothetical protein
MKGSSNKSTKMDVQITPGKKEIPPLKERLPFIIILSVLALVVFVLYPIGVFR